MLSRIFCVRLSTAGVIIGWTNTAIAILSVILYILALFHIEDLSQTVCLHMNDQTIDEDSIAYGLIIIISIYICLYAISLLGSALLIVGTIKENHLLLLPWLVYNWFSISLSTVYFLYCVFFADPAYVPQLTLIFSGFNILMQLFWWYIILSLYKRIQDDQEVDLLVGSDISYHLADSEKTICQSNVKS